MNVACVLRSGGPYGPADVQRLQSGVAKFLPVTHRFVCFSDVDVPGVERIALKHDWPKWWPKIEMLGSDLRGLTLYLDLDTLIVGDLTPFASYMGRRALLRGFYQPERANTGVMIWWDDALAGVYNAFTHDPDRNMRENREGDAAFIRAVVKHHDYVQDIWPGLVVSFKVHCRAGSSDMQGRIPADARVVCFHGKPRPNDLPRNHWIWKAAA